jgi:hopanoid biosynthesis associated RND transporter like protein HpnN
MLTSTVVRIVDFCVRKPWPVVLVSLLLTVASAIYAAKNFAITTDVSKLLSGKIEWRDREQAFEKAFPTPFDTIMVVIDSPTSELSSQAADVLIKRLKEQPALFLEVRELSGGPFFAKNALLYLPTEDLTRAARGLGQAGPLIATLATDPNLRGLTRALSLVLAGVQGGRAKLEDIARALTASADAIENVLAGRPASFSWRALMNEKPEPGTLRRFVEVRGLLDYSALEPGAAATTAIRKAVLDLKLPSEYQARVRLTGPVPISDEEFATVQDGALVNTIATVLIVLTILWLALRSPRIIFAVFVALFVGLAVTAALGLMIVGALNLISIAFAVLFVGLGVDFGIQFAVRYRSERFESRDLRVALRNTAEKIGAPLTLAAAAVAAGFLSFYPTHYRGVSELGQIAGVGMLIAYITSITLLPSLLALLEPPGEPEEVGYKSLAPVDRFLERHRIPVIAGTGLVALAGAPLLYFLTFDFNPINLRSATVESVATFLDLRSDPNVNANAINVIAPTVQQTAAIAETLRKVPEVSRVQTLLDFVPTEQDQKLPLIQTLARQLGPSLSRQPGPAPSDEQNIASLTSTAEMLSRLAAAASGPSADAAKRLAEQLLRLSRAAKAQRDQVEAVFVPPLRLALDDMRGYIQAEAVTLETLPPDLYRQWVAADGSSRVEASPAGDPNDNETLRSFARAVLAKYPTAVGGPISILESGRTVVTVFIQAGAYALISIALLLWVVLKRFGDVLLTLVPLLLAGVVTLEICVLIGMPLNFANIIALPLLLGVGVAFKIYYIMAWRAGQTDLLQSSLTRAVIWSALTTATAFGSLWLSNHPGTSGMGKLLALSLICTLAAAVLFQPALMGKPRDLNDAQ